MQPHSVQGCHQKLGLIPHTQSSTRASPQSTAAGMAVQVSSLDGISSRPCLLPAQPRAWSLFSAVWISTATKGATSACPQCPAQPQAPAPVPEILSCQCEHSHCNSASLGEDSEHPSQLRFLVESTEETGPDHKTGAREKRSCYFSTAC